MIKQKMVPFKQKQLLTKVMLMMYLSQSTIRLYQYTKNLEEKVWDRLDI